MLNTQDDAQSCRYSNVHVIFQVKHLSSESDFLKNLYGPTPLSEGCEASYKHLKDIVLTRRGEYHVAKLVYLHCHLVNYA